MAKYKKRTKAERSAAAKAMWARRRASHPIKGTANNLPPVSWTRAADLMKPDSTSALIAERGTTHGDYGLNAEVSQRLKAVFEWALEQGSSNVTAIQKESTDLICTKLGRIYSGNPNFPDHWDDLAGYAKLVADHLRGK